MIFIKLSDHLIDNLNCTRYIDPHMAASANDDYSKVCMSNFHIEIHRSFKPFEYPNPNAI